MGSFTSKLPSITIGARAYKPTCNVWGPHGVADSKTKNHLRGQGVLGARVFVPQTHNGFRRGGCDQWRADAGNLQGFRGKCLGLLRQWPWIHKNLINRNLVEGMET